MLKSKLSGAKKPAVKGRRVDAGRRRIATGEAHEVKYFARKHGLSKEEALKIFKKKANKGNRENTDDAPELTEEFFERADWYRGDKLVRAGRPPSENPKLALKLRIDPDVIEYFRATGPGWQTRINDTLRRAAKLPARK